MPALFNVNDTAIHLADNYINGNISDTLNALKELSPIRAAAVALSMQDHMTEFQFSALRRSLNNEAM